MQRPRYTSIVVFSVAAGGLAVGALLAGLDSADSGGAGLESAATGSEADSGGQALYLQHCSSCHGALGEGQPDWKAPNEDGSLPAPPHNASGHTWHHADAELLRIIAEGGTIYMPESTMPAYGEILSPAEMRDVLTYIKMLWGPRELSFQAEASANWDAAVALETPAPNTPEP